MEKLIITIELTNNSKNAINTIIKNTNSTYSKIIEKIVNDSFIDNSPNIQLVEDIQKTTV